VDADNGEDKDAGVVEGTAARGEGAVVR